MSVTPRGNSKNSIVKATRLKCEVHQYNPFTKKYTTNVYKPGVKWFTDKTKGLHRAVFNVGLLKKKPQLGSKHKHDLKIIFELVKAINGTPALKLFAASKNWPDLLFPELYLVPYAFDKRCLKPNQFQSSRLYVPVKRSVKVDYDLTEFLKALALLIMITMIFFIVSRLSNFDVNTWSLLSILEMITGNGNARNPVTRVEVWAFFTMILVGFFFGLDLVTGLTSTVLVEETEVKLKSYEDMKSNNLTLHLTMAVNDGFMRRPALMHIRNLSIPIVKQQNLNLSTLGKIIKYRKDLIRQIITNKNVSFANTWYQSQDGLPKRFVVEEKVQAELSSITLWQDVLSYFSPPTSLFIERLSDLNWRAFETGLFNKQTGNTHKLNKVKYEIYERTIAELEHDWSDDDVESCIDVKSLLFLLVFGWCLAIFSLFVELLIGPRVNRNELTAESATSESDEDSSEFDFDQEWIIEEGNVMRLVQDVSMNEPLTSRNDENLSSESSLSDDEIEESSV